MELVLFVFETNPNWVKFSLPTVGHVYSSVPPLRPSGKDGVGRWWLVLRIWF